MLYFDFCGSVGTAWSSISPYLKRGVVGEGTWVAVTCSKRSPEGGLFRDKVEELLQQMDAALEEMDCYSPCRLFAPTIEFYHYAGGESANSAMCTFMVQIGKLVEEEEEEAEGYFTAAKHYSM